MLKRLYCLLLLLSSSLNAGTDHHPPIEMSSKQNHQQWLDFKSNNFIELQLEAPIKKATDAGLRMHEWLFSLNSRRKENPIKLTNATTRLGFPLEKPKTYSPKLVRQRLEKLLESFPESMKKIIFQGARITTSLPSGLSEKKFIAEAYKLDRIYQSAVRWQTVMLPYKSYYSSRLWQDVRGIYDLKKIENLETKLTDFSNLEKIQQERINKDIVGLCLNNRKSQNYCDRIISSDTPRLTLYKRFIIRAERNWNSFFKLQNPRRDVVWDNENEMKVIFADPKDSKIASFLKDNIEDEFSFADWSLKMEFVDLASGVSRLEFKSGVTPHVNKLGGNIITMDKASSIDEYDIKWTIRHEYGHILGLPDCYFEFYDSKNQMGVSYQIDTSDLMCSRAGDFNERLYLELKKAYYK